MQRIAGDGLQGGAGHSRTATISDTVRHTEVDIEDTADETRKGYATDAGHDATRSADDESLGDKVAGLAKEGYGKIAGNDDLGRGGEAQQGMSGYYPLALMTRDRAQRVRSLSFVEAVAA